MVRVRFAPSPTGHLHIGSVRTALFNWLFAQHHKGKFILRIEDTDLKRSTVKWVKSILDALLWLGIQWDEGPYYQSKRFHLYREYAERMIKDGTAYRCYCTKEDLEKRRKERLKKRVTLIYDGRCRELRKEEIEIFEKEKRPFVVRLATPPGITTIEDLIHGKKEFDNSLIGDFILMKSDATPSYNFACVVDDITMEITHVIRGDDHLSNTPRQLLIYKALGASPPFFAHLPMILGPDRKRLSKRHGATSIDYYRKKGYLPEALINYLALLGWGTFDSQQIFTKEELISKFSLDRVSGAPAIFDIYKLRWMNGHYIASLNIDQLSELLVPYLGKWTEKIDRRGEKWFKKLVSIYQVRIKTLEEFAKEGDFFFKERISILKDAEEILKGKDVPKILKFAKEVIGSLEPFEVETIEKEIRGLSKRLGLKAGEVIHPIRVAITGRRSSPPIFDTIYLIGKEKTLIRLNRILKKFENIKEKA
jgi:glutamyl-tRNA synthetase